VEVVASLSQGRTAAAQCDLFTHKSVPVIFEPPCNYCVIMSKNNWRNSCSGDGQGEDDMGGTVSTEMFEYNATWTLSHVPGWSRLSNWVFQDNSVQYTAVQSSDKRSKLFSTPGKGEINNICPCKRFVNKTFIPWMGAAGGNVVRSSNHDNLSVWNAKERTTG